MSEQRRQYRLDVDYGEDLLTWLREMARASGRKPAEVVREAVLERRLRDAAIADAVREALLALSRAVEPSEDHDPADDPSGGSALSHLAALLGSLPAARGIALALNELWRARHLPEARGIELDAGTLDWLDELVARAERPHTRETFLASLIGEAYRKRAR